MNPVRSLRVIFVLLVCLGSIIAAPAVEAQESKSSTYAGLLARVQKDDRTVDLDELRLAYTETKDYNPYGPDREARKAMFAALSARDYAQSLQQADKQLASNYLDINAHFAAAVSHRELQNRSKAEYHEYLFRGLLKSIAKSGDGKSTATAMVVISTDEEYALLNFLGLRVTNQALVNENGHHYDKMTAVDSKTNEASVYYFNVDKLFSWLGKKLN
jgi:hypothetical protein